MGRIIRRRVVGLEHRQRMPNGVKVVQYFGLSFDEPRRVSEVRARFMGHSWAEGRFPLFELEMTRGDCVDYLKGQPIPQEECEALISPSRRLAAVRTTLSSLDLDLDLDDVRLRLAS